VIPAWLVAVNAFAERAAASASIKHATHRWGIPVRMDQEQSIASTLAQSHWLT